MKSKIKSIAYAVRRIRELDNISKQCADLSRELNDHCKILAKYAADGPCFFNPLEAMAAKTVRDMYLKRQGLNPNGTAIGAAVA